MATDSLCIIKKLKKHRAHHHINDLYAVTFFKLLTGGTMQVHVFDQ